MSSGLDKISSAPQIKVDQTTDWIEIIPCCEKTNKYTVYNTNDTFEELGEEIGIVDEEDPGFLCLFCCKACRKYETKFDINNFTVAKSTRPFKCAIANICNFWTCLECCQQELDVFQKDQKIGSIRWPYVLIFNQFLYACFCNPNRGKMSCAELDIKNENDEIIYKITANATQLPFIVQCFCGVSCGCINSLSKKEYSIVDTNDSVVGSITNIYNDLLLECCTRADKFAVKFPTDADVNKKLLLLKAAVFLDFIHYAA